MINTDMGKLSKALGVSAISAIVVGCASQAKEPQLPVCEGHAYYQVIFDSTWSAETHPEDFPAKPHYSHLFGATHNSDVTFWAPGSRASAGIKDIAEKGSGFAFIKQVDFAIRKDEALAVFDGNEMKLSPGISEAQFKVTSEFPRVTLLNMLAPSPDWITGVSSMSLCENGSWLQSKTVNAVAYDGGTDDGPTYTSEDVPRDKREAIAELDGSDRTSYKSFPSVGSFTFTKIDKITKPEGGGYVDYVRNR